MIHYVKLVHFIFWTFLLSCSGNELLSCDVVLGNLQRINMVVAFYFYFLGGKTPDPASLKNVRTYKDIMEELDLHRDQVHYDLKINNTCTYAFIHLIANKPAEGRPPAGMAAENSAA